MPSVVEWEVRHRGLIPMSGELPFVGFEPLETQR